MSCPGTKGIQDVWTVRFDGPLAKGDCGSLVIDANNGQIYGHIIAGSPQSGVAYIIPAFQVYERIQQHFNTDLEFRSFQPRPRNLYVSFPGSHSWKSFKESISSAKSIIDKFVPLSWPNPPTPPNPPYPPYPAYTQYHSKLRLDSSDLTILQEALARYDESLEISRLLDSWDEIGVQRRCSVRRESTVQKESTMQKSRHPNLAILVAALGFFTDAYDIFAINMVAPLINLSYLGGNASYNVSYVLNVALLWAMPIGLLFSGVMADLYGRRAIYGLEIILVFIATIFMAFAETSTFPSLTPLIIWRVVMGVGIGADYPSSAVISAE
jgi:hypothetical protein